MAYLFKLMDYFCFTGCDDTSVCSEPVGRGQEEEVDRLRTSLGVRNLFFSIKDIFLSLLK
jgi:hypothetical protein